METQILRDKDKLKCLLSGELSIYIVNELKNKLTEFLSEKDTELYLDLSGVSRVDTAGIQLLIAVKIQAGKVNKKLHFLNHSEELISSIDLYGLMSFFGDPIKVKKEMAADYPFLYGRKKGFY